MGRFTENRKRTLSQADFIRRISKRMGVSQEYATLIVQSIRKELIQCLQEGLCET